MRNKGGTIMKDHTKGIWRRIAAVIAALVIAAGVMPFAGGTAYAETVSEYNAQKAVDFAKSTGKNYKDCVKFARACAEKGGVPRQKEVKSYNAVEYMNYLTQFGYAVKNELTLYPENDTYVRINGSKKIANLSYEANIGKLAKGDLLVYKCKKCGKHFHMAIVTDTMDTLDYYNEDGPFHAWMVEAQSANGKRIKNQPFFLYNHNSKHGKHNVAVYAMHFTSAANGFEPCEEKIGTLTAKKITKKKVRLKWPEVEGAVAYNIYARGYIGGPVLFQKQVTSNNLKVAVPKNKSGKLYNYKNVRFTVAPVFERTVSFEGVETTYKVIGKRRALVKIK
jgi:hypothetical protein